MIKSMDAQEFPSPILDKARAYFADRLRQINRKGQPPIGFQWEPRTFFYNDAAALERGESVGYTGKGADTASTKEGYQTTLTTETGTDVVCSTFGYGEYGINTVGKTIVDVGAGDSPFSKDINNVYGEFGTKVIAVDPKYEKTEENANKISAFVQNLTERPELCKNGLGVADEVISNFGVALVPPAEFPQAILEMLAITKSQGIIKIVPCHVFKEIKDFNDEKGHPRQKVGETILPYGVRLTQRCAVDGWRCDIDKQTIDTEELKKFLESLNTQPILESLQFWDSKGLLEKRKKGFYVKKEINSWNNTRPIRVDEDGRIIED